MSTEPRTRAAILQHLQEHGPSTTAEIAEALGAPAKRISVCISAWRRSKQNCPPRIKAYDRREGCGGSPIQVWAPGPGPDAPRPKPLSNAERLRRVRVKFSGILRARRRTAPPDPLLSVLT